MRWPRVQVAATQPAGPRCSSWDTSSSASPNRTNTVHASRLLRFVSQLYTLRTPRSKSAHVSRNGRYMCSHALPHLRPTCLDIRTLHVIGFTFASGFLSLGHRQDAGEPASRRDEPATGIVYNMDINLTNGRTLLDVASPINRSVP